MRTIGARFLDRVHQGDDGHWRWRGSLSSRGKPLLAVGGRMLSARRVFAGLRSPLPAEATVRRTCLEPACVVHVAIRTDGRPAPYELRHRFSTRVDLGEGVDACWTWAGSLDDRGRPTIWDGTRHRKAHHVAYELFVGELAEGAEVRRTCRNRLCVRPEHLVVRGS